MAGNLGELWASLGLDTSQFSGGTKKAEKDVEKLNRNFDRGKNAIQRYTRELTFLGAALRFSGLGKLAELIEISKNYSETSFAKSAVGQGQGMGEISAKQIEKGFVKQATPEIIGNAVGEVIGNSVVVSSIKKKTTAIAETFKNTADNIERYVKKLKNGKLIVENLGDSQWIKYRGNDKSVPTSRFARYFPTVKGGLSSLAATGGITPAMVGLGATGAAIGALGAIGVTGLLAKSREAARAKEIESIKSNTLVKEIESIADPMKRLQRIIDEFGKDGQAKFREMQESAKNFKKEIESNKEWRQLGETAYITFDAIWSGTKKVGRGIREAFAWLANKLQIGALGKETVDALVEGEANIALMQEKRDKMNLARLEKQKEETKIAEERLKLQEQLQAAEFNAISDPKEKLTILEKQLATIKHIVEATTGNKQLQARIDQKNIEKEITAEKEKQKKVADDLTAAQKEYQQALKDQKTAYSDRYRYSVDELAGQQAMTPYGRYQVAMANEVKQAEYMSKLYAREGMFGVSDRFQNYALNLRKQIEGLTSNEREPMKQVLDNVNKSLERWTQLAESQGIRIIPINGR